MQERDSTNRIEYLDIFRGIGIILMVLDHIGYGSTFYQLVHAFHMPMFFFASGFCYRRKGDFKRIIKKKSQTLLLPYLVFGVTEYILWKFMAGDSLQPLINLFWVNTGEIAIAGALWFLSALFFAYVMYYLVDGISNVVVKNVLLVVIALAGNLIPILTGIRLPYGIDSAMVGVGFMHLGRLLNDASNTKYGYRLINLPIPVNLIMSAIVAYTIFINDSVNMRTGKYSIVPLFWVNALLSIIVLVNYSKIMERYLPKKLVCALTNVGQNGTVYVCINQLVIAVISRLIVRIDFNIFTLTVIETIIVFTALYIATRIINGTKLRVIIGK